ncbi:Holliday junction branch migration DNA helicase RuvB [Salipiger sp. PrR003]|uniref:Holliday junction branch migration DNA helicase RuvB n=1 Tax=Salipiger sp. PrR003 TaxID=2706776 RepID=UPI0013DC9852|nr:Holliday junction branch migration DNA helicase RuvB [Salipiger sp. PrR003]NDV52932.1 Holliday junction branch migration DNA helicase RuvB [Salipiger sp. PrR003]
MNDIVRNEHADEGANELRPTRLTDFTGQTAALENLSVYVRSARRRGDPLDHVLFYGPPGLGKTTLSQIIAEEMETNFRSISAPAIKKPGELATVLVTLQPGDVLFIDEIHRLPLFVEELLYSAMEDYKITILVGEGHEQAEPIEVRINPFTLVGATTRKGSLSQPLLDRFGIQVRLTYYEDEDLTSIVQGAATKLGEFLDHGEAFEVARRSRGTPRIAIKLLKRLRDFRQDAETEYSLDFVVRCLDRLGITSNGLDDQDIRYLDTLRDLFGGGPTGIETLAIAMAESRDTLETSIEPFLIRQGLITKTSRGRLLVRNEE